MAGVDLEKCKRIVQYFWDPEPKNDTAPEASIWCLGQQYTSRYPEELHKDSTTDRDHSTGQAAEMLHDMTGGAWPNAFLTDFESRIWMTYRSNFAPIPRSHSPEATSLMTLGVRIRTQLMDSQGFTSDTGWGCMIRSGQSLLANTLCILLLDWRKGDRPNEESKLLAMFADQPEAPFSIHRFVKCGADSCGKYPGEWFGPSATARCIQILSTECNAPKLEVYVTNDTSDVYEEQFLRLAHSKTGQFQPTLILLGLRLGIEQVTSVYWDGLRAALKYPQSVGIAGGRPSASHYFVGVQDSHLFFLDPHTTRPTLPHHQLDEPYTAEERGSYHTRRLRRIHLKDMDPSMLIGFLIKDEADWTDWKQRVKSSPGKPIIHILTGETQLDKEYQGPGRKAAVDEVEALDDSDEME
ncbi:Peptidase C54 [Penicillium odoratum]|uniref:Peptidase C54 n=1 Tax=Penicillium odoratum TaxID=1167516 RepID=UPI0025478B40|nr:Peptidase C54 [Penicillium odoratum]KAJ5772039.1 Peptidase C54 [Penicillium odoratum]